MMDFVRVKSDYSPNTCLIISQFEDGDISLKILGNGEMRIAMCGGQFHGNDLVEVQCAFRNLMDVIKKHQKGNELDMTMP